MRVSQEPPRPPRGVRSSARKTNSGEFQPPQKAARAPHFSRQGDAHRQTGRKPTTKEQNMAAYDQNGLVTIEAAKGTATGREAAGAFLTPTPTQWSFSSLVDNILAQLTAASVVVIDTVNRKVFFTDDPTKATALKGAADADDVENMVILNPDSGQTGRSLTWTATDGGNFPEERTALENAVGAAKPRKTVASLVSSVLSARSDETDLPLDPPKLIIVDQIGQSVQCNYTDTTAAVAALSLNAGELGRVDLD